MTLITIDLETYPDIPPPLLAKLEAQVVAENPLPDLETQLAFVRPAANIKKPELIAADIAKRKERVREQHIEAQAAVEAKKAAIWDKAALSPLTGRIVAVGLGICRAGEWEYVALTSMYADTESNLLLAVDSRLAELTPSHIITFNGRRFDLPFLFARASRHGISFEFRWPAGRYSDRHIDLTDYYEGKQDHWAALLTGAGKATQGAAIAELVEGGRWDEVREHVIEDVRLNALMYDRISNVLVNLPTTKGAGE